MAKALKRLLRHVFEYRHGPPHDPDEPDAQKCIDLYDEIIGKGIFTQADAGGVVELIKKNIGGTLETRVNELRIHFNTVMTDAEERKAFVYLLAKFVKSFHFISAFFSYEKPITDFAAFCEYVGPQLIKAGSVSDLMKQIRATVVEKAAVTDQGTVNMPAGQTKPKPSKGGGGGGGAPVKKISVQDMIAKIREEFQISEEEALHIREVSEEKIADESVQQTVAAHRADLTFLDTVFRDQVNGGIQDAYALRQLYEQLTLCPITGMMRQAEQSIEIAAFIWVLLIDVELEGDEVGGDFREPGVGGGITRRDRQKQVFLRAGDLDLFCFGQLGTVSFEEGAAGSQVGTAVFHDTPEPVF